MSVSPDEGMQLLTQRMAADRLTRDGAPDSGGAAGPGLELAGDAGASFLLSVRSAMEANTRALRSRRPLIPWEWCHPVPLAPVSSPGGVAGTISDERWEPREGVAWQVVSVAVVFGAGTTLATVYRDSAGPQNQRNQQATGFLWEPKAEILLPNSRLIFTSVGGPITVNGQAIEIALDFLPEYLA